MSGAALPLTLEAACGLSLDAFLNSVDDDQCAELIAVLVEILMGQQVRTVRRLLNTKACRCCCVGGAYFGFSLGGGSGQRFRG